MVRAARERKRLIAEQGFHDHGADRVGVQVVPLDQVAAVGDDASASCMIFRRL